MNQKTKFFTSFVLLFSILSCEKDLRTDVPITPQLCFNCILNPDSLIRGSLTLSRSISEDSTFTKVDHAIIELKKDGRVIGTMQNTQSGVYQFDAKPTSGSLYEIKINAEGFATLAASTIVPKKPSFTYKLDNPEYQDHGAYSSYYIYRITYTIQDESGPNKYWLYKTRLQNSTWRTVLYYYDVNSTLIDNFNKVTDAVDKLGYHYAYFLRINDTGLDGKTLTFSDKMINKENIYLMDVDVNYDKYLKSTIKQDLNNSESLLFNEPVQIYSNVENGLGIFGSAAITSFKR